MSAKIETAEEMALRIVGDTSASQDTRSIYAEAIRARDEQIATALESWARSVCQPEGQYYARQIEGFAATLRGSR